MSEDDPILDPVLRDPIVVVTVVNTNDVIAIVKTVIVTEIEIATMDEITEIVIGSIVNVNANAVKLNENVFYETVSVESVNVKSANGKGRKNANANVNVRRKGSENVKKNASWKGKKNENGDTKNLLLLLLVPEDVHLVDENRPQRVLHLKEVHV